jgi:hypothetical protein
MSLKRLYGKNSGLLNVDKHMARDGYGLGTPFCKLVELFIGEKLAHRL